MRLPIRTGALRLGGMACCLAIWSLFRTDVLFQHRIDPFQDRGLVPLGVFLETSR